MNPIALFIPLARFHSEMEVVLYLFIAIMTLAGIILYPMFKLEWMAKKASNAKLSHEKAAETDAMWNLVPNEKMIRETYSIVLQNIADRRISTLGRLVHPALIEYYSKKYLKWDDLNISYRFVWMEINTIQLISVTDRLNDNEDALKFLITGVSVDYMHENNSLSAMGTQTRKKKEFQDIIIFKRYNQHWLIEKIIKDAWDWQL